jgi:hypothetical protein
MIRSVFAGVKRIPASAKRSYVVGVSSSRLRLFQQSRPATTRPNCSHGARRLMSAMISGSRIRRPRIVSTQKIRPSSLTAYHEKTHQCA